MYGQKQFRTMSYSDLVTESEAKKLCIKHFGSYKFGNRIYKLKVKAFRSKANKQSSPTKKLERFHKYVDVWLEKRLSKINCDALVRNKLRLLVKQQIKLNITDEDINVK